MRTRLQLYSLAIPTEKAPPATTTKIVLTVPKGFSIDSFVPNPGWHRVLQQTGSGDSAVHSSRSPGQAATFRAARTRSSSSLASSPFSGSYTFEVAQTYSDGSIVDWAGSESSAYPAPTISAKSSLGGGGTSTLTIIALVVGAVGVILGAIALFAGGGGKRQLA